MGNFVLENSEKIIATISELLQSGKAELYLLVVLFLFTLWFIRSTIRYYYGEKRKLKHMHRFAREGDLEAQQHLAKRYQKGDILPKSCERAAYWYQKAALSGDEEAKGFLEKFLESHRKKC